MGLLFLTDYRSTPRRALLGATYLITPTSFAGLFVIRNLCQSKPTAGCHEIFDKISPQAFTVSRDSSTHQNGSEIEITMTLPVSAVTYFAPNRWYNGMSTVIYDDQISASKVASNEFLCLCVDGSRFWHSSIMDQANTEIAARPWLGGPSTSLEVTAISWSES